MVPRREGAPARRAAPRGRKLEVRRPAPAAGLAFAVAFAGGCSSGPRLHSADLALEAERPGEGRASITALALDARGERLLVGDYTGRLFDFAVADFRRNDFAEPRSETFEGGVLALGCAAGRFVAVPRRGRGLISDAAADPAVVEKIHFPALSGAVVTPALGVVHWSVLLRTLAHFACASGGTTTPAVTVANASPQPPRLPTGSSTCRASSKCVAG
jgi:hypothetical protein